MSSRRRKQNSKWERKGASIECGTKREQRIRAGIFWFHILRDFLSTSETHNGQSECVARQAAMRPGDRGKCLIWSHSHFPRYRIYMQFLFHLPSDSQRASTHRNCCNLLSDSYTMHAKAGCRLDTRDYRKWVQEKAHTRKLLIFVSAVVQTNRQRASAHMRVGPTAHGITHFPLFFSFSIFIPARWRIQSGRGLLFEVSVDVFSSIPLSAVADSKHATAYEERNRREMNTKKNMKM